MLAEGTRLFDLKRWGQGFKRDINAKLAPLVDQVSSQEVASADLSPQNLYHYYAKGNVGDMPIKTAYKFKRLVDIYEAEYGILEPSSRVLDVKELEKFLYSGMITGYAISKTGLMNATNGNLYPYMLAAAVYDSKTVRELGDGNAPFELITDFVRVQCL